MCVLKIMFAQTTTIGYCVNKIKIIVAHNSAFRRPKAPAPL